MSRLTVGLIAPGEMGAAVASCVTGDVGLVWASEGRSSATRERAATAGLDDVGTVDVLVGTSDLLVSICPPHAALATATEVMGRGFAGRYLDANAIAPATAERIAAVVTAKGAAFLDGGIIGGPPGPESRGTRLYLAGPGAADVAGIFATGPLSALVLDAPPPAASALKLAYAAWTKGSAALLLTARALAVEAGIEDDLLEVWDHSMPGLRERSARAAANGARKGWRWVGEMQEIAVALRDAGLPAGCCDAAAEVYARLAPLWPEDDVDAHTALAALARREAPHPNGT